MALDTETGRPRWIYPSSEDESFKAIYGTPAVSEDTVYVGTDDGILYALDINGARQLWIGETGGAIVGGPLVVAGMVLGEKLRGRV